MCCYNLKLCTAVLSFGLLQILSVYGANNNENHTRTKRSPEQDEIEFFRNDDDDDFLDELTKRRGWGKRSESRNPQSSFETPWSTWVDNFNMDYPEHVYKRRGWGKRSMVDEAPRKRGWSRPSAEDLEQFNAEKRKGWGKRSGLYLRPDSRQGWGKRSQDDSIPEIDITVPSSGFEKRRGWGKRSVKINSVPIKPSINTQTQNLEDLLNQAKTPLLNIETNGDSLLIQDRSGALTWAKDRDRTEEESAMFSDQPVCQKLNEDLRLLINELILAQFRRRVHCGLEDDKIKDCLLSSS